MVGLLGYGRDEKTERNLLHLIHAEDRARAAAVLEACAADDADFAESLLNVLQARGYELLHVADAAALWAALEGFHAEVALVDVRLGRVSGLDLVAELKARRPAMLNVVMTAYVAADSAIEALRTGAYDYLTKPFAPNQLLATLDR